MPGENREALAGLLGDYNRHVTTRKYIEDYLTAAEEHMREHDTLGRMTGGKGHAIVEAETYPGWREEAERLTAAGETILSDKDVYGPHLNHVHVGTMRVERKVMRPRRTVREDSEQRSEQSDSQNKTRKQERKAAKRQRKGQKRSQGGGISL